MDTQIPEDEVSLARLRLEQNPSIRELLGPWINPGFANPVLGQNILLDLLSDSPVSDEDDPTTRKVHELERTLTLGKSSCQNFSGIFRKGLASDPLTANGQTLDSLAEVEAFCWLMDNEFSSIRKLPERKVRTVDFACDLAGRGFGVEVTRLGIPTSDSKRVDPIAGTNLWRLYEGERASAKISFSISDAVERKRTQIKSYLRGNPANSAFVVVSTGRRFVMSRRVVRRDAGALPGTWRKSVETAWYSLERGLQDQLVSIILLDGPNVAQYPELGSVS